MRKPKALIVLLGYALLILSFCLPLPGRLSSFLIGSVSFDLNMQLWYQEHVNDCLLRGDLASLFRTDLIAFPSGWDLLFNLGFPALQLLSVPFQLALPFPSSYNLFMLAIMTLNGLACFALLRHLWQDRLAAFIGGLFFAVNPYMLYQVNSGRAEQAAAFWIPLSLLALSAAARRQRLARSAAAALALVMAFLSYWYYGVFLMGCAVIMLLFPSDESRAEALRVRAGRVLPPLAIAGAALFALFFYPVFVQGRLPAGYDAAGSVPSLAELLRPPFLYMATSTASRRLPAAFLVLTAVLVLLPLSSKRAWGANRPFCIAAYVFFILALGPYVQVGGWAIPMPFIALHRFVPTFSRFWWPVNCMVVVLVCAAAVLAHLVSVWRARPPARLRTALAAAAAALYLLPYYAGQYAPPKGSMSALSFVLPRRPHPVDEFLKTAPEGAVIALPLLDRWTGSAFRNQTTHGKRIFHAPGHGIRDIVWPKAQRDYLDHNPGMRYFRDLFSAARQGQGPPGRPGARALASGLEALYDTGFRYIVVNLDRRGRRLPRPREELWRQRRAEPLRYPDWVKTELRQALGNPFKEYPDGVLLYRFDDFPFLRVERTARAVSVK